MGASKSVAVDPVIHVRDEAFGLAVDVAVIPPPADGRRFDREFRDVDHAMSYARGLAGRHGWPIRCRLGRS